MILKSSALSLAETFLIISLGFVIVRKKWLPGGSVDILSQFIVKIAFPAYIFTKMTAGMGDHSLPLWWLYPLLGIGMILGALAIGYAAVKGDRRIGSPRELLAMNTFQNGAYLPLPLVAALFPEPNPMGQQLVVAIILFIAGYNFFLWSLGVILLSGPNARADLKSALRMAVNPPFIATIISLLAAQFGLARYIPGVISSPIKAVGDCTIPVIMVALGGILGEICMACDMDRRTIGWLAFLKLVFYPALMLAGVWFLKPPVLVGIMLVMEAAMPPATTLPIIARMYGGNANLVSQSVFFSYLCSIITIPVFMSLVLTILGTTI